MPDLFHQYEQKHIANIAATARRIKKVYEDAINEIALTASRITYKDEVFTLSKYPALKAKVDEVLSKMHTSIYAAVVNSMQTSWDLSNQKNDLLVDRRLAGKIPTQSKRIIYYNPNINALEKFIYRKEKGLNLSGRVWNSLEPFKTQLEGGLGVGISEGQSAAEMARSLKQYLNNPDKLFRRIRNDKGQLKLFKAAREFHPGQGVYRSSYKNALRLTISETNSAYRTADYERWNKLPFVLGIEVRTSNNHPEIDICDRLKGLYPKDFKFVGWHSFCLCYAIPKMMDDKQYSQLEDQILGLSKKPMQIKGIEKPPASFTKYVSENKSAIKRWKSKPYWVSDNKEYVNL